MASTNKILQHPCHQHPLEIKENLSYETCDLCRRKIWSKDYYTCREEGCETPISYHRACAQAPPRIDPHPLHMEHPLTLNHGSRSFTCDECNYHLIADSSSFRCDECDFDLDTGCALSALTDRGGSQDSKTLESEQITLQFHTHPLTSFSTRHDFVGGSICYICRESVGGDGYTCLQRGCDFVVHKRCVPDLYYADGTKAPTIYHEHQLEIQTSSKTCASCGSDESGEFFGCGCCGVFYHRQCFQVPEIITYPSHDQDHRLVLFLNIGSPGDCECCSVSLKGPIYYGCTSCEFLLHIECASKVLAYVEEGMSAKIELSWHNHPLFLCYGTKSAWYVCDYCRDDTIGPMYLCNHQGCGFALHKRCTEVESTITHPHHPEHPLSLGSEREDLVYACPVCGGQAYGSLFSCKRCLFNLHLKCAAALPTHKHYLHEHMLVRLERFPNANCNRCGRSTTRSPLFRCVPCNFNLHEECMELPRVVKSKIHWHPLTLQSKFLEDDSGEYYCEECEQTRDPRLGVYVCGQCHISIPRIYHIHCVLPELAVVYEKQLDDAKERLLSDLKKLDEEIADQQEKLEEVSRKVEELLKERTRVLDQVQNLCNPSI